MRNLTNEFRRALGWGWIAAVAITLVPLFLANVEELAKLFTEQADMISLVVNGFHKSAILPISLFALTCPYAGSCLSDISSGVIKHQLARTGRAQYVLCRFVANAVSASTAILFAQLLFMGFCFICYPYPDVGYRLLFGHDEVMQGLLYQHPACYFLILLLLQVPSTMAWASLALGCSVYVKNQFVAMCIPFLIFTMITSFSGNPLLLPVFRACVLIYDGALVRSEWAVRLAYYFGFFGAMICISYIILFVAVKRYDGTAEASQ